MSTYERLVALLDSRGAEFRLIHHAPELAPGIVLKDDEILVVGRADVSIALRNDYRWLVEAT
jgi:hypothetical protein